MFGNDRELKEKTRLLEKAFFHWAKIIIALDPAIRKLQIDDYKDYIARYENDHGDFSMMRTEPKEAVKDLYIIYKNVLEIVEEWIKSETYEGENYIWGSILGVKSEIINDQNSLFNKRLKQVKEDFPEILCDEDEDEDEDEESLQSLENELKFLEKKKENTESLQDLKPISDKAFSDSINKFLMENAAEIISCNYWTLHEIKSHMNPETWEKDQDHLESVIRNYNLLTNKDDLLEWIKERIDLYEGMGYLDQFLKIGKSKECDYSDSESFLKDLDTDYVISVLKICWDIACSETPKEVVGKKTNSWDDYYSEFDGNFDEEQSLGIELIDTEEVRDKLEKLGYKINTSNFLDCSKIGEYFPTISDESEESVIIIFHKLPLDFDFDEGNDLVKQWFGFYKKYIKSLDPYFMEDESTEVKEDESTEVKSSEKLQYLKNFTKNWFESESKEWLNFLVEKTKERTYGHFESKPEEFWWDPKTVEDWEYECAAALTASCIDQYESKGKEFVTEMLRAHFAETNSIGEELSTKIQMLLLHSSMIGFENYFLNDCKLGGNESIKLTDEIVLKAFKIDPN